MHVQAFTCTRHIFMIVNVQLSYTVKNLVFVKVDSNMSFQ